MNLGQKATLIHPLIPINKQSAYRKKVAVKKTINKWPVHAIYFKRGNLVWEICLMFFTTCMPYAFWCNSATVRSISINIGLAKKQETLKSSFILLVCLNLCAAPYFCLLVLTHEKLLLLKEFTVLYFYDALLVSSCVFEFSEEKTYWIDRATH